MPNLIVVSPPNVLQQPTTTGVSAPKPVTGVALPGGVEAASVVEAAADPTLIQAVLHLTLEMRELRRVYCELTGAMFLDLEMQKTLPSSP